MTPKDVVVYEKGDKAFVADKTTKKIFIYNGTTNKEIGSIKIDLDEVTEMVVDEKYGKLYVCGEYRDKQIAVVDAEKNSLLGYIKLPSIGTFPIIAHDEIIHKVYVLFVGVESGLIQIDVASDAVIQIPNISGAAYSEIAVNPVTHEVYIVNLKLNIVNGLTLSHFEVPGIIGLGLGINHLENKAYIGCYNFNKGPYRIGVYDRSRGTKKPLNPENDALQFAFNPSSNRMYTSSEVDWVLSIIDGKSDSIFNMPFESPARDPKVRYQTNHVYYAGMDYIAVLNDSTQLVEIIPVENKKKSGIAIQEIAINQKSGRVYVINDGYGLNFVTVIQDEEPMSRPPVYLGTCGQYGIGYQINVFDPGSKSFLSEIEPPFGVSYHSATFKPGGGRYYIPIQQMGFKISAVAEYAGFEKFMSIDPIRELKTEGDGSKVPAVSPDGRTIYVTNSDTNDVSAIDYESGNLVRRISVGRSPLGMDITEDGKKILVANKDDDTVSVIDAGKNSEDARIDVGDSPWGVAVNPSGKWAYVANNGSNTVSVIRIKKESVFATIPVGSGPRWLTCSPDGKQVWVSNSAGRSISVIDTSTNKVVKTVSVDGSPEGLCFLPDGSEVYVGTGVNLTVIKTSSFAKTKFTPKKGFGGLKQIVSAAVGDPTSRFAGTVTSVGVPLRGVLVEAYRDQIKKGRTTTNLYGDYAVHNLPPGKYEIKITKSGYISQKRTLDVQAGQTKILDINLKKS